MPIPANGMIIEKTTVGMPRKDALAGEINAVSMFYFQNILINNNRNNSRAKPPALLVVPALFYSRPLLMVA
jgi:hypothetical protein